MKEITILEVGGVVRDRLLGRKPKDVDFVVVGTTAEQFENAFPGSYPTGKAFPVFRYEDMEFALARTEKKEGAGHKGFAVQAHPDVTLEQDLLRRDFTCNAIAQCPETGTLCDPYNGREDIKNKILRPVNPNAFADDPLRIYRMARFAAQLEFTPTKEAFDLAAASVEELRELSVERVWVETEKALQGKKPSSFFRVLQTIGALDVHFPEVGKLYGVAQPVEHHHGFCAFEHTMEVLDQTRHQTDDVAVLWAALVHDLGKGVTPKELLPKHHGHDVAGVSLAKSMGKRLKVPKKVVAAGLLAASQHMRAHRFAELRPGKIVRLLEEIKKFPGGVDGFWALLKADGSSEKEYQLASECAAKISAVKLPDKWKGLGKKSGELLFQLKTEAINKTKKN